MSTTDRPWQDEATLRKLHHDKKLCIAEIGRRLGCTAQTVSRWLRRNDVEVLSNSNSPAGEEHHAHKDKPRRTYDKRYRKLSQEALERDNYSCRGCGLDNETHRDTYGSYLHCHHKGEDHDRGDERANLDDLIILCAKCHRLADENGTGAIVG